MYGTRAATKMARQLTLILDELVQEARLPRVCVPDDQELKEKVCKDKGADHESRNSKIKFDRPSHSLPTKAHRRAHCCQVCTCSGRAASVHNQRSLACSTTRIRTRRASEDDCTHCGLSRHWMGDLCGDHSEANGPPEQLRSAQTPHRSPFLLQRPILSKLTEHNRL